MPSKKEGEGKPFPEANTEMNVPFLPSENGFLSLDRLPGQGLEWVSDRKFWAAGA